VEYRLSTALTDANNEIAAKDFPGAEFHRPGRVARHEDPNIFQRGKVRQMDERIASAN
jgi:hypothetical protein